MLMCVTSDVYSLINYTSFIESSFIAITVTALVYLRWKQPDLRRPVKVNISNLTFFSLENFFTITN